MATTKFDARAVIDYIEGLEYQISSYEKKAADLYQAYNDLINLDSFEGEAADAVKTLTKDVQVELLESVVQAQKYLKDEYVKTLDVFQENVDSSDDALIEISVLEEIHNDYSEKQKIFEAHASKIENIASAIQQKYGDLYPVTQPDFTDCRNDFKALVGDDTTKGIFQKTIDALEEFDYSETQRIKNADLDTYLDDLDIKITSLKNLLEDSTVLATDYVLVNQYIDAFKNDMFSDGTLADKIFLWMECSEDEKLKQVVHSKFYKNLKLHVKAAGATAFTCKQGLRFLTEHLDLFGRSLKDLYKKHSDELADATIGVAGAKCSKLLFPSFMTLALIEKIYPESEFNKKFGTCYGWVKSFIKGGQTCTVDMGTGIFSMPETKMDLVDKGDNALVSAADYIRHNGINFNSEHTKKGLRDGFAQLEAFTSETIDALTEKVNDMSVNDAFFAAGYAVAFIFGGKAVKEIVETAKGLKAVSIGAEAIEETEVAVEGAEATKDAEIIIDGAEAAEVEISIEGSEIAEEAEIISKGGNGKRIYTLVEYRGTVKVNGEVHDVSRRVYQRNDIDINYFDEVTGLTNLERMQAGKPPIGPDGNPIQLHHILQKEAGPMVEIQEVTHHEYYSQLHGLVEDGYSFRNNPILNKQFNNFRYNYWKWRAEQFLGGN